MNKVVGGSLPARLWHDVMLVAHEGGVPSAATQPARNGKLEPLMPRERIGSEFVDRAVGEDGNAASSPAAATSARRGWIGAAKDLLRRGLDFAM
jgi:hypothetical protein